MRRRGHETAKKQQSEDQGTDQENTERETKQEGIGSYIDWAKELDDRYLRTPALLLTELSSRMASVQVTCLPPRRKTVNTPACLPPKGVSKLVEEKKISVTEVKRTIATSLAAAFGFVIALLWNSVVVGGLKVAKIDATLATFNLQDWIGYLVTAVVLTVVMVVLIIVISRWGSK